MTDLERGRLSQRCPVCSTVEAAGYYATCHPKARTGPADWFRPEASAAAKAARQSRRTGGFADAGATKASAAVSESTQMAMWLL